jgi:hypothetical protein
MSEYDNAVKLIQTAEERIAEIDEEIRDLKYQMQEVQGEVTEVYSRIVGYYRNTNNWNPGKKDEYKQRKVFDKDAELPPWGEKLDIAPNWMKPENNLYTVNKELSEERIM